MKYNIHLALVGSSATVTGVELWAFNTSGVEWNQPTQGIAGGYEGSIRLRVTLSNGAHYYCNNPFPYEYVYSRKVPSTTAGYYRFAADHYFDSDADETVYISAVWTDWYYLDNDTRYIDGVLQ